MKRKGIQQMDDNDIVMEDLEGPLDTNTEEEGKSADNDRSCLNTIILF